MINIFKKDGEIVFNTVLKSLKKCACEYTECQHDIGVLDGHFRCSECPLNYITDELMTEQEVLEYLQKNSKQVEG